MGIKNVLVEELTKEVKELSKIEVGSDKYRAAVEGVTKLANCINDIDQFEAENMQKESAQFNEYELKHAQLESEKRDRKTKNGIAIGTALVSVLVYGVAFIASTNFEREGSFTTEGGKNSIRQLLKLRF